MLMNLSYGYDPQDRSTFMRNELPQCEFLNHTTVNEGCAIDYRDKLLEILGDYYDELKSNLPLRNQIFEYQIDLDYCRGNLTAINNTISPGFRSYIDQVQNLTEQAKTLNATIFDLQLSEYNLTLRNEILIQHHNNNTVDQARLAELEAQVKTLTTENKRLERQLREGNYGQ